MKIAFTIFGEPTAKGRPRFFRAGNFVRTYTPKDTLIAENDFRLQSLQYKPAIPLTQEILLTIKIYRKIPKSFSKLKVIAANSGAIRPTTKPDWDNYGKLVCDAMNGIFWKDDSQIVSAWVEKYYSDNPRIEIALEAI